jgi:class 3 adenylate cyclase
MTATSDDPDLTLDAFLALHPFPREHAGERRLQWLWTFDLPVAADDLWRVIADTSRLNRALGLAEMKFEDRGAVRRGTSRSGGLRHAWIEVPWDWVAGQWLASVRLYERGFVRVVYGVFRFSPRAVDAREGTRLHVYFGTVPRGFVGALALRIGLAGIGRAFGRVLPVLAAELGAVGRGVPAVLVQPGGGLAPEAEARLATIEEDLRGRGLDARCVERLGAWIRAGDDHDLFRIQVRERALAWGVDEDALLRVCLHATRAGMLELSWDLMCPHCRGVSGDERRLGELPAEAECQVCGISFASSALTAVEITFHVHASIREVERRSFCSAEPASKDHIRVQRAVPAGDTAEVASRLAPGRYRLRLQGERRYGYLDVGEGEGDPAPITWRAGAAPADHASTPASALRLVNDTQAAQTFVVEAAQWSDLALRPGRLLSFPEFRGLFSEEYLGVGVQLGIGEQTILFTDMIGSTALYVDRGDPGAFVEVKRHFDEVQAIFARHRGALVKTIGDAAMGAFCDPLDALKAALEVQGRVHEQGDASLLRLRISLNTGPCIAVRLDTGIDYFGHTVNVAAKLQALVESWQVALTLSVYQAPGVAGWLADQGARLEDLEYASKAIRDPIAVKRWTVYP